MKKGDKVVCVNVDLTSDAGDAHTIILNMGAHFEDETGEWHKKIDYMKFHGELVPCSPTQCRFYNKSDELNGYCERYNKVCDRCICEG